MILSFGGIPLLCHGDAIGTLNSLECLADPAKAADNRWMHRSHFDWNKAERRHQSALGDDVARSWHRRWRGVFS